MRLDNGGSRVLGDTRGHHDSTESGIDGIDQDRLLVLDQLPCQRYNDTVEVETQNMSYIGEADEVRPASEVPLRQWGLTF